VIITGAMLAQPLPNTADWASSHVVKLPSSSLPRANRLGARSAEFAGEGADGSISTGGRMLGRACEADDAGDQRVLMEMVSA